MAPKTPYYGGQIGMVRDILAKSNRQLVKIFAIGDSRQDTNGSYSTAEVYMNRFLVERYGFCSELPVTRVNQIYGSASVDPRFCVRTQSLFGTVANAVVDPDYLPPKWRVGSTGGTNGNAGFMTLLDPFNTSHASQSKPFFFDDSRRYFDQFGDSLCVDWFLKKSPSGPANLRWIYEPNENVTQDVFETDVISTLVSDLDLQADDVTLFTFTTDPMPFDATHPYPQCRIRGDNGSGVQAGLQVWGHRWRHTDKSRGVLYQSLAVSGSTYQAWSEALTGNFVGGNVNNFHNALPAINEIGLPDVTFFFLGTNDHGMTSSEYVAQVIETINNYRTFLGEPDHPVAILAAYERADYPLEDLEGFDTDMQRLADAGFQAASSIENCEFFNLYQAMNDMGLDMSDPTWSTDDVHAVDARLPHFESHMTMDLIHHEFARSTMPIRGRYFAFNTSLVDASDGNAFLNNPTLAAGDVKIVKGDGAAANIEALPTVSGKQVKTILSPAETNADRIVVEFADQTDPKEWADVNEIWTTTSPEPNVAESVRSTIETELANLDAPVSSRATSDEVTNNTAGITATRADIATMRGGDGDSLETISDQVDQIPTSGGGSDLSGANTVTITVDDGTNPIQNAKVRLSLNAQSGLAMTDVNGQASFSVDDGTWSVAITAAGYQFAPTTLEVNGNEAETYSMVATSINPSTEPSYTTAYLVVRDDQLNGQESVPVQFRMVEPPSGSGNYFTDAWFTVNSGAGGVVSAPMAKSATYEIRITECCENTTYQIPVDADATHEIRNNLTSY